MTTDLRAMSLVRLALSVKIGDVEEAAIAAELLWISYRNIPFSGCRSRRRRRRSAAKLAGAVPALANGG